MKITAAKSTPSATRLPERPAAIPGLGEITGDGLQRGRPTLICGGAGCRKTLMASEFAVLGAMQFDKPGAFMAFEERETG